MIISNASPRTNLSALKQPRVFRVPSSFPGEDFFHHKNDTELDPAVELGVVVYVKTVAQKRAVCRHF